MTNYYSREDIEKAFTEIGSFYIERKLAELQSIDIVKCKECTRTDENGYCNIVDMNPPLAFYCREGMRKTNV